MKNLKNIVIIATALVAGCFVFEGCNRLQLPDDWQQQNIENLENATFAESAGSIDPQQT